MQNRTCTTTSKNPLFSICAKMPSKVQSQIIKKNNLTQWVNTVLIPNYGKLKKFFTEQSDEKFPIILKKHLIEHGDLVLDVKERLNEMNKKLGLPFYTVLIQNV